MDIKERILARRDLDEARVNRDIDALAAGLNEECQPSQVPSRTTLDSILHWAPHADVIRDLLESAANGESVQSRAAELLSPDGVEVMEPGFEPPMVNRDEVNDAMFNPDGSEK